MKGTEPNESDSEDEIVEFDNSASDVIKKHNFPLTLPSGHLNGVRSLPPCTQKNVKAWQTSRLCGAGAAGGGPVLESCDRDWPSPAVGKKWEAIQNDDHLAVAEGRYTSAFTEMGVRVHRRLMAMADVALKMETPLGDLAVTPADAIIREEAFDALLTQQFDEGVRDAPSWEELAYFVAGFGGLPGPGAGLTDAEKSATQGAVRNYAPCREVRIIDNIHWSHSDCWIVHHFAYNAWATVRAWATNMGLVMKVLATEKAVIWPFGLHTGKTGAVGSRAACGKPFETRIDLVCTLGPDANTQNKFVIVEFKTNMERSNPYENDAAYLMNKGTDCRQPILNAWLYYFNTLRLPSKCLLLYTTRRDAEPPTDAQTGKDNAIVGEIDFEGVAKEKWCVQLISTFARGAYGGFSNGRYADSRILVPDLRRLMDWSRERPVAGRRKKGRKTKRPAEPELPKKTDFNSEGFLHVFREVLPGSRFQCLLDCAKDGTAVGGVGYWNRAGFVYRAAHESPMVAEATV